jgi:CBS domain-containing protein
MTRNPVTIKQDTDIKEIIDIILQRDIILVPGLLGRSDIGVIGSLKLLSLSLVVATTFHLVKHFSTF